MANVALIRFSAFFLGLLAILFLVIAIPTHHWYHAESIGKNNVTYELYGGIFENCRTHSGLSGYSCVTQQGDGYIKATKAFLLLAVIEFAVVVIYTLIFAFRRGICYNVLGILTLIAGLFTLVGMSIYTSQHSIDGDSVGYGYSYALGWTSSLFSLIAGILLFFGGAEYEKI